MSSPAKSLDERDDQEDLLGDCLKIFDEDHPALTGFERELRRFATS
jgi:hypothetical protein